MHITLVSVCMRKFIQVFYLFFCAIALASCTHTPTELITAEQLIETAPDSAFHILQSLNSHNLRGKHNRALYALLMSRAMDKNDILVESDSLITIATDYFDNADPEHAGYGWFYKARTAHNSGNQKEEATNLLKAQEFAEKTNNSKLIGLVFGEKGQMYRTQHQYDSSICYYKQAYKAFSNIPDNSNCILCQVNIGTNFLSKAVFDSALVYFKHAELMVKKTNNTLLYSTIYRNIGSVYLKQKKYKDALTYFHKVPLTNIDVYDSNKWLLIANVFIKTNKNDSVRYYLQKVNSLTEMTENYYLLWLKLHKKEGNYEEALTYAQKIIDKTDSINKRNFEISFAGLEKKYKYQGLQITNQNLTIKNKQRGLLLLFALLSLTVLIVVFLYWRLKAREKELEYQKYIAIKRHELLEKEKENSTLLERQLKLQTILLSNIQMHQTNTVKRPTFWREGSKETIAKQYELFYNELKAYIDLEFNNFTTRLKDNYPVLTENDIFISCLLLANFETGMIATILNVQVDSINKQRYRLRTKLKLSKSDHLIDFLLHF